ncbi:MAG: hypothetical protein AAFX56_11835 [Pseudomonadota bacterium]
MIRMLGVLCGAAIAIALLTWLVGVPQFSRERSAQPDPITLVELPAPVRQTDEPVAAASSAQTDAGESANTATKTAPPPSAEIAEIAADAEAMRTQQAIPAQPAVPAEGMADVQTESMQPPAEAFRWFAFWSPFRSEIAANGFVERLQSVTGIDYRVVKLKPGVYEVAFAYSEDDEIDLNLAAISAATGLKLAGTQ